MRVEAMGFHPFEAVERHAALAVFSWQYAVGSYWRLTAGG
jgi:hypothetical protein